MLKLCQLLVKPLGMRPGPGLSESLIAPPPAAVIGTEWEKCLKLGPPEVLCMAASLPQITSSSTVTLPPPPGGERLYEVKGSMVDA